MTDSARGALGPIYLAGKLLDKVAVGDQDFTAEKLKEVVTMPSGGAREAIRYQGADMPMLGLRHRLVLHFSDLGSQYDLVQEILSAPGPYEVVVWKRVPCVYAGDGDRVSFTLPWYVRDHFAADLPVPGGLQAGAGSIAVYARVGLSGDPLTVLHKSAVDYAAGEPAANEAWFLEGGLEFKVGTPPEPGARLYVRYVPILPMFEEAAGSKRYPVGSVREPLDLALVEA